MRLFLGVFGTYMVVIGALLCATPRVGKRLTDVWMKDKVSRGWALVTAGVGLLFLWAASASRAPLFIQVLGALSILKGIYLLVAPRAPLLAVVKWWNHLSPGTYRVWGLVTLAMGAAVLWTL